MEFIQSCSKSKHAYMSNDCLEMLNNINVLYKFSYPQKYIYYPQKLYLYIVKLIE